ncbi:MAG: GNAT family N-acetyltransferase, partial [Coriobacteriia bacterium]|nr:GNAT family N-acetyltransferase [Coriobacteriia bacterium]
MKRKFEGVVTSGVPIDWQGYGWLDRETLSDLEGVSDIPFRCVVHPDYSCTEYDTKLNLFTFGRIEFRVPVTVIGPPLSVDCAGYEGDFASLIDDYRRRSGLFLALNLPTEPNTAVARAQTLASCVFHNRFSSFDEYLAALRSSYRRRILQALAKGSQLEVQRISNHEYTDSMHELYLQVMARSVYPLETLTPDFFRRFKGEIYVFYENGTAVAFVSLLMDGGNLNFIFGGQDYEKRDRLDLYYNMLIFILRYGIEHKVK